MTTVALFYGSPRRVTELTRGSPKDRQAAQGHARVERFHGCVSGTETARNTAQGSIGLPTFVHASLARRLAPVAFAQNIHTCRHLLLDWAAFRPCSGFQTWNLGIPIHGCVLLLELDPRSVIAPTAYRRTGEAHPVLPQPESRGKFISLEIACKLRGPAGVTSHPLLVRHGC